MKNLSFIIALLFYLSINLSGQNRVEKPLQVQFDLSGVFLKTLGNTLADSEVDELKVTRWGMPGISVGYHLNRTFFVSYTILPCRNLELAEKWGFTNQGTDGNIVLDHSTGVNHSIAVRMSPFKFGLYGGLFYNQIAPQDYTMNFTRIGETIRLGDNEYTTDLIADWQFKRVNTLGFELGYNWVTQSGLSFNIGLGLPLMQEPLYQNINIKSVNEITIAPADLEASRKQLEKELFYYPVQFQLRMGYNISL